MSQLVILLPLPETAVTGSFAYVLSDNGQAVTRHGTTEASLLPFAGVQDVVAMVPVHALSWHSVQLPKGSNANAHKLRTVLEGLLEDRLLDEPARLHLALAPGTSTPGHTWVAACDAVWLRMCMDALEQAGCTVNRIVPEFQPASIGASGTKEPTLALSPQADDSQAAQAPADARLYAIGGDDTPACWVRTGSDMAHATPACGVLVWPISSMENAVLTETLILPQQTGGAWLPPEHIQSDPAVARAAEHWLRQPVAIVPQAQRWLQAAQSPWNLSQFDFANTGSDRLRKRAGQIWHRFLHAPLWHAVRLGLVTLLVVQLLGLNWWAWRTRAELAVQKQDIDRILTSTFPEVQTVIDAPVQMERQTALLRQTSGQLSPRDMEAILSITAQHMPDARPQGLVWDGSQLRLKGLAFAGSQQSAWNAGLTAAQLQSRQDGTDWLVSPIK